MSQVAGIAFSCCLLERCEVNACFMCLIGNECEDFAKHAFCSDSNGIEFIEFLLCTLLQQ